VAVGGGGARAGRGGGAGVCLLCLAAGWPGDRREWFGAGRGTELRRWECSCVCSCCRWVGCPRRRSLPGDCVAGASGCTWNPYAGRGRVRASGLGGLDRRSDTAVIAVGVCSPRAGGAALAASAGGHAGAGAFRSAGAGDRTVWVGPAASAAAIASDADDPARSRRRGGLCRCQRGPEIVGEAACAAERHLVPGGWSGEAARLAKPGVAAQPGYAAPTDVLRTGQGGLPRPDALGWAGPGGPGS
jgi:hypothetical protein